MTNLKDAVAPCALFCHTCFGYADGAVRYHAEQLHELYKGWYEGHVKGYGPEPNEKQQRKLESIRNFNQTLSELSCGDCPGCRKSKGAFGGCIRGCIIPQCVIDHQVEYCAFCPEFPCDRSIPENIRVKWLAGNTYIKEHGLSAYFEKDKGVGHYSEHYEP